MRNSDDWPSAAHGSSMDVMSDANTQEVLSVTELTALLKEAVEATFPAVWICGEVTNVSSPRSGHVYFTLKDAGAQIRAVVWRSTASRLKFEIADGMEVVCGGGLDLYPPRGSYQLVVRKIEPRGLGAQQQALRKLQERLASEGLFDSQHKQRLPHFPGRIAMVTSPTGAAIRDFCEVSARRWPVEITVIPVRVQGTGAAKEIADAIQLANRLRPAPDVLVVGRGGGSAEDLWSFNDEGVVRAIFASRIPVVSAVGHEIDVTLSDLVADLRALTPSEAAELVAPSRDELIHHLHRQQQRLGSLLRARAGAARARLAAVTDRRVFRRPFERLQLLTRRLDESEARMARAVRGRHRHAAQRWDNFAVRLESLNPLAVLSRGYSISQRTDDGRVVVDPNQLKVGDRITTTLANGTATSRVEAVERTDRDGKDIKDI
jgi:exodeoxyribonuclease VII large subunit